jgi:CRISPR-associated protein Csd1
MILQSLAKLAEREGLIENPDYQPGEVSWVIRLKPDGRFIALESLLMPPEGKKGKPRGQRGPIPRRSGRTSGVQTDFLVDNAQYVLGINVDPKKNPKPKRLAECREAFQSMVAEAATATASGPLQAVLSFLSGDEAAKAAREVVARAESKDFASNHLIAFAVESEPGLVHHLPAIQKHWSSVRKAAATDADGTQCLVTGVIAPPIDKHPPIKRVPGGSSSGVAVVSYNSSAFESYGLKRNENAPISRAAAEAYATALNRLLEPATLNPREPGVRLPEQRVQIAEDTVAVFWTDTQSVVPGAIRPALDADRDGLDCFGVSFSGDIEESPDAESPASDLASTATAMRDELERPWQGQRLQSVSDDTTFRLLILSGGQGRATVRQFHTSHTKAIVASIQKWFQDIELDGWHGGRALYQLQRALALRGDRKNLPPSLAADVFVAILMDRPLPASVLETAVRRARSESAYRVTSQRAAFVKAYLTRSRERLAAQGIHFQEIKPAMNQNERNQGYLLGRMFACIERMQEMALGDVGASVTDKYFSAACATPQAVFPRLLKSEVHHFRKAREGRYSSTARWLHGQIGNIANWLVGDQNNMQEGEKVEDFLKRTAGRAMTGFPAFLPLAEQGLFTLGYHQQRSEFFKKREKEPAEVLTE